MWGSAAAAPAPTPTGCLGVARPILARPDARMLLITLTPWLPYDDCSPRPSYPIARGLVMSRAYDDGANYSLIYSSLQLLMVSELALCRRV